MELFIGNLPDTASMADLDLLLLGYQPMRLRFEQVATSEGQQMRFALVTIVPDRVAQRAISKLHNHRLHGRKLVVREYVGRDNANERRLDPMRAQSWSASNRRQGERRTNGN